MTAEAKAAEVVSLAVAQNWTRVGSEVGVAVLAALRAAGWSVVKLERAGDRCVEDGYVHGDQPGGCVVSTHIWKPVFAVTAGDVAP